MKLFKAITKHLVLCTLLFLFSSNSSFAQENIRIAAFNVFEYKTTSTTRDANFITVIDAIDPDILIGVEIENDAAAEDFRTDVLNNAVTDKYLSGFSPPTSASGGFNNVVFYKPAKFTFLSGKMIVDSGKWPTLEFQLYHNLTGNKLVIYGVHLTSGQTSPGITQRGKEADTIRASSDALASGEYFIAVGDFNIDGGDETAFTKLTASGNGKFLDPAGLTLESWHDPAYAWFSTFDIRITGGTNRRFDLILISQTVDVSGGIQIIKGVVDTVVQYGNDGKHYDLKISDPPEIPLGQTIADALFDASDHLPVYADFTFDFPTAKNPPYPGSIVFTQVGADDDDVIEFMTLYRMDLTTLYITDNSITDSTGGPLTTTEGTYDLSNTTWTDVPGGTYVRLDPNLANDDDASDRLLIYDGTGSGTLPSLTTSGEQLIAYTGSSSNPTYIAGVNWGNAGWLTNPTGSTSYAPGTLSDVQLGSSDNYYYSGSVDDILYVTRDSLTISGNWSGSNTRIGYKILGVGDSALPVELIFFTANLNGNKIELRWRTETEVNNYGFEIERSTKNSEWRFIGFVDGYGNSNSPKQ
ncbi:MAG: hypothetical protein O6940_06085, partial [Ignavibacteria bacterium]|nr:hypothetical protein [Ignavibacteria bacterium]